MVRTVLSDFLDGHNHEGGRKRVGGSGIRSARPGGNRAFDRPGGTRINYVPALLQAGGAQGFGPQEDASDGLPAAVWFTERNGPAFGAVRTVEGQNGAETTMNKSPVDTPLTKKLSHSVNSIAFSDTAEVDLQRAAQEFHCMLELVQFEKVYAGMPSGEIQLLRRRYARTLILI